MRYLRDYRLFESSDGLTDEQRKFLDRSAPESWSLFNKNTPGRWSVNSEGLVDVRGDFVCVGQELEDFLGIRFGKVSGDFDCSRNQLKTLKGSPREVGGTFDCNRNQLKTLEGAPLEVVRNFYCHGNELETLEGSPREVGGDFSCAGNQLKTLEEAPRKVGSGFYCSKNPLISLEGSPEVIKYEFWFKNTRFEYNTRFKYNLQSFLKKIDHIEPDEISLLLTHHFFTVDVIKEQITKNPDFPYYVSLAWNTEGFNKKQEKLQEILPENILAKIDRWWSIGGYL